MFVILVRFVCVPKRGGYVLLLLLCRICCTQLELLIGKCFGDFQFLLDKFAKLEIVVAPAGESEQFEDYGGRATQDSSESVLMLIQVVTYSTQQ